MLKRLTVKHVKVKRIRDYNVKGLKKMMNGYDVKKAKRIKHYVNCLGLTVLLKGQDVE